MARTTAQRPGQELPGPATPEPAPDAPDAPRPDLLLVCLDTVRPDALGLFDAAQHPAEVERLEAALDRHRAGHRYQGDTRELEVDPELFERLEELGYPDWAGLRRG